MTLLIDGSALITTSFYGSVPKEFYKAKTEEEQEMLYPELLKSPDGQFVNAIVGFMRFMRSFIEYQQPDYIAVCFDATRNTFRRKLFPDYKGNRSAHPRALSEQIGLIQDILDDSGIQILDSLSFEADDLIGSLANKFGDAGEEVKLFTKDQDYFQLVNDAKNIKLWLWTNHDKVLELGDKYGFPNTPVPYACFEFDEAKTLDYYGVTPTQVPDKKGIVGDTADNIPGVKGVGEKAAIPLLKEYGTLENIYEAIHNSTNDEELEKYWKTIGLSRRGALSKLKNDEETAKLSKVLATIKTDCPLPSIEELKDAMNVDNVDYDIVDGWYDKLGIKELIEQGFEEENEKEEDNYDDI